MRMSNLYQLDSQSMPVQQGFPAISSAASYDYQFPEGTQVPPAKLAPGHRAAISDAKVKLRSQQS